MSARLGLRAAALGYLGLLVAVPVGLVFWRTFEDGLAPVSETLQDPGFVHALWLTVLIALIAVPLNTTFGVVCALVLVRQRFAGKRLLNVLIDLPFALSPVVVGLALVLVYGRQGWLGEWFEANGVRIIFALPGMVLATIFVSLPFVVREVVPVLREVGKEQDEAAWTLGASPFATFWRVTLPAIRWGLIYGVVLTTARALGEFGAVSVVSGRIEGRTETLTLYVQGSFENFDRVGAYTASVVLALLAVMTLLLMNLFRRKEKSNGDRGAPREQAVR
ncbi:MAG TPA: sulfate ABC transporter permease subunit CysW [Gaiellaceae bacterium]